ncbi:uncharacterized protein LOC122392649 isoform X2 [Amphibalanus amphitrite]|uniref:uncharacterized protein LOC122392649 isoform X2 n=1 Tax=Amphibalanus amphitrite TaxID=1232801 RepID=UPI001C91F0DD|nr:uncharacterized protein LOC122392649 isoform X2 [Amphibalanus amphitrite]
MACSVQRAALLTVTCCALLAHGAPPTRLPDLPAPLSARGQQHPRPPRSFEGHQAPLNRLQLTPSRRREMGSSTAPPALPGAWLRSPDPAALADSDSGAAMDYRTERYHIADLFAEGTG